MSVKVMGMVWDADLPRPQKLVLLAYADHAAHDGSSIYPSVERMMHKTGYSRRSVQKITRELQEDGILLDDGSGPSGVNRWKICLSRLAECATSCAQSKVEGGAKTAGGGAESARGGCRKRREGVQNLHPNRHEPSIEPHAKNSADALATPLNLRGWLERVRDSSNKSAAVRGMIQALYPYYNDDELPTYGRVGSAAKKVGGWGRLVQYIWLVNQYEPQGNLMDYVAIVHRNGSGSDHDDVYNQMLDQFDWGE